MKIESLFSHKIDASTERLIGSAPFFIHPEVSWSGFFVRACLNDERHLKESSLSRHMLSELGSVLCSRLQDGVFVDVPCGDPRLDKENGCDLLPLVRVLGCKTWIKSDVSIDVLKRTVGEHDAFFTDIASAHESNIRESVAAPTIIGVACDVLALLASIEPSATDTPLCIYLSGLQYDASFLRESDENARAAAEHLCALYDELGRMCGPKDTLILNDGATLASGIESEAHPELSAVAALSRRGFVRLRTDAFGKVGVFVKAD